MINKSYSAECNKCLKRNILFFIIFKEQNGLFYIIYYQLQILAVQKYQSSKKY